MYAVKYPEGYFDSDETQIWFTRCNADGVGCGWVDETSHRNREDCDYSACPECGCDDVVDETDVI